MRYYGRGYNILKTNHRYCNITAGDYTIKHLAYRFPIMLGIFEYPKEMIDKVKYNIEASLLP